MNVDITKSNVSQDISIIATKRYKEILTQKTTYQTIKRILDVILSSIGLVILLPVFALIGIAIKIESKGPIFFKHTRIGKNGKIIKIYKFRTMVKNAEQLIKDFTPEQKKEYAEYYKLAKDPRVTKIGKILRKTSLDELPQLINIIKGELSLIGPRPVVNGEIEKYGENIEKFLSITPGLTGYWAANGRSGTTYEQRMEMELYYVDNMSFILDVKIFFKTIEAVLKRQGAM